MITLEIRDDKKTKWQMIKNVLNHNLGSWPRGIIINGQYHIIGNNKHLVLNTKTNEFDVLHDFNRMNENITIRKHEMGT